MDRESLIERVGAELFGYLMEGQLSRNDFAAAVRPDSLEERYDEYEQLAKLHFLLSEPVIEFVDRLPERLRQLKTETTRERQVHKGAIRGRVEWSDTYRRRTGGDVDQTQYVCTQREETRDTPENLILKYVIEELAETLITTEEYFNQDANWVAETWGGDQMLRNQFLRLREQNVHLQALDRPTEADITPRMVRTAETAREALYRQAAFLYSRNRQYLNGDKQILRDILADATVLPEDEANLFELYVLFETIQALSGIADQCQPPLGSYTLKTLRTGRSGPVAVFNGRQEYNVFYDQSGQSLNCSFYVDPASPPEQYSRGDAAATYGDRTASNIFGSESGPRTKRPDVLIAPRYPQDDPTGDYLIIEVKHSTRESTIQDGIRELTQYLAYFRRDGTPVFQRRGYMGCGLNGLLVVGERADLPPPTEQSKYPVTIVRGTELPNVLPDILTELLADKYH